MKKKILILSTILLVILAGLIVGPKVDFGNDNPISKFVNAITIGPDTAEAAGVADYTCDGTDDNVQFQTAMNALPAGGGKLTVLAGTYSFSATVTRAIANVSIDGMGISSSFTYNGVNPIFTAGGNNWTFSNLKTDAGGINVGATTGWLMENVTFGTTVYGLRTSASENIVDNGRDLGDATTPIVAKVYASNAPLKPAATDATNLIWVCDDTDDGAQIIAAKAVATEVQLSEGTFNIDTAIEPTAGVTIQGVGWGTILKATGTNNSVISCAGGTSYVGVGVKDLQVDGNKSQGGRTSGSGLVFSGCTKGLFSNLKIVNCYNIGMEFNGEAGHPNGSSTVQNVHIESCTDYGLKLGDNTYGVNVIDYTAYNNGINLYGYYADEMSLTNLNVMQSVTAEIELLYCNRVQICNAYSSDAHKDAVIISRSNNISLTNVMVDDANADDGTSDAFSVLGITASHSTHISLVNCKINTSSHTPRYGLLVSGDAGSIEYLTVSNCDFMDATTPVYTNAATTISGANWSNNVGYVDPSEIRTVASSILGLMGTGATPGLFPCITASGTSFSDYGKASNHLTVSPTIASWATAPTFLGKLVLRNFDGSNDYFTRADDSDFYVNDTGGAGPATWFFIGNIPSGSTERVIFSVWDEKTGAEKREWRLVVDASNKLRIDICDETNNLISTRTTDAAVGVGALHVYSINFAGTNKATEGTLVTMYEDGLVVASTAHDEAGSAGMSDTGAAFYVGAYTATSGTLTANYNGSLAWFGMAKKSFNSYEHWQLYQYLIGLYK